MVEKGVRVIFRPLPLPFKGMMLHSVLDTYEMLIDPSYSLLEQIITMFHELVHFFLMQLTRYDKLDRFHLLWDKIYNLSLGRRHLIGRSLKDLMLDG